VRGVGSPCSHASKLAFQHNLHKTELLCPVVGSCGEGKHTRVEFQRCPRGTQAKRASGDKSTQSLLQAGLPAGQGDTWDNKEEFQKKNCLLALLQHLKKGFLLQSDRLSQLWDQPCSSNRCRSALWSCTTPALSGTSHTQSSGANSSAFIAQVCRSLQTVAQGLAEPAWIHMNAQRGRQLPLSCHGRLCGGSW
jgi:hypothetical protein